MNSYDGVVLTVLIVLMRALVLNVLRRHDFGRGPKNHVLPSLAASKIAFRYPLPIAQHMYRSQMQLPKIGPNVIVRRLEERDLTQLYALESDPEVKRFVGGPVTKSSDQWIAGMRAILPNCGVLTVVAKDKACFAGTATIANYRGIGLPTDRDRELTVLIAKSFWGRGLGKEVSDLLIPAAFSELNAERVVVVTHPENRASLRLTARLGFTPVGVVADSTSWQDGHHIFVLCSPVTSRSPRGKA